MKPHTPPGADQAAIALLTHLSARAYRFITPTPATHERVAARPRTGPVTLADVLGWNRPFAPGDLELEVLRLLQGMDALDDAGGGRMRSRVRVSSLQGDLFLHSGYPTDSEQSVFFGPDSYRFADLIRAQMGPQPDRAGLRVLDIGAGSGVGAIVAARCWPGARVSMTDINPEALRVSAINARVAGLDIEAILAKGAGGSGPPLDVIVANPPYMIDAACRAYRDGGALHGGKVSVEIAASALARLAPGGRLILYTGSAIIDGEDRLAAALADLAQAQGCSMTCREVDPDVFGEELESPAYADVDRIAIIAVIMTRPMET